MSDKPRLDPELVCEFVGKAHGDLEHVQKLLKSQPKLLNAAWDWGGGDWETGLGAAAHVGRRDIALFLIAEGARMDIFAAAMLGHLEVVQATLEIYPEASKWPGPHGIPLLRHAEAGAEAAMHVAEFLRAHSGAA